MKYFNHPSSLALFSKDRLLKERIFNLKAWTWLYVHLATTMAFSKESSSNTLTHVLSSDLKFDTYLSHTRSRGSLALDSNTWNLSTYSSIKFPFRTNAWVEHCEVHPSFDPLYVLFHLKLAKIFSRVFRDPSFSPCMCRPFQVLNGNVYLIFQLMNTL